MATRRKSKNRSGFLFLFIVILLLGVIVYAYRDKFFVLYKTGFASGKNFFSKKNKKDTKDDNVINLINKDDNDKTTTSEKTKTNKVFTKIVTKKKNTQIKQKRIITTTSIKQKSIHQKNEVTTKSLKSRVSTLYFSTIDANEILRLTKVKRSVKYDDTPLTNTLKELVKGPTSSEKNNEIVTNIPSHTKIRNVWIKNNVAYVDLSKDFEFNNYGKESTLFQLKQIIYTATEFSSVNKVQFLINGEKKTYLGGEGITINKPLSRSDFS